MNKMNVVIRTDASLEVGTGHVMRCVTLAKQLERKGANVTFICRNYPGNSISYIQSQGFNVHIPSVRENQHHWQWRRDNWTQDAHETKRIIENLNKNVDLLIVDHYGLDAKWESALRPSIKHIMVIDDLANRPHDCDILLDQNYYLNLQNRYTELVSGSCIQLLGPNFVLLRDEFISIDLKKIERDGSVKNVLVFFGGTDPTGETMKTIQAIQGINQFDIEFNVVVGEANPKKEKIEQICSQMSNVKYHCQISNMSELMVNADLAIGAGGTTSWERCYLGLPSIIIIVADNQKEVANAVAEIGAAHCLGESTRVSDLNISKEIKELCNNSALINEMIQGCWKIVDPNIVKSQMVIKNITELLK